MRSNGLGYIGGSVKAFRIGNSYVSGKFITYNSTDYTNGAGDRKSNVPSDTAGHKNLSRQGVKVLVS